MASISKRGDRKYLVRISKGTGKNRVVINKTVRGTKAEAIAVGRRLDLEISSGQTNIVLTFETALTQWLKATEPKISKRTHGGYKEYIHRYAKSLFPLRLKDIKTSNIQDIYLEMNLSSTTIRNLHGALRAFFNYMIRMEVISSNPCKNADLPQKSRKEIVVLSLDEAREFVSACTVKNGIIFEFALETGARPEEYLALRWRDIDFQNNTVSINRAVSFNRKGGGFYFTKPKTAKSRRSIPISQNLRNKLIDHRRSQNEARLASMLSYAPLDLVFANSVGHPYSTTNLAKRYFQPVLDKLELPKRLTLYSLRHSCATLLLMLGENPKVVADRLGHSSVTLTLDTYSHVLPGIQKEATAKLDNVLRIAR